jgi:hypothetical protein
MTHRRAPGPPDWPTHHTDAAAAADPRSRARGLLAGGAVVLIGLALAVVGPWSDQTRILVVLLGWMAAVGAGSWAYRGASRHVRSGTRLLLLLAAVSLLGAATLLFISLQVRDILAGSVSFGASGSGCEVAHEARSFAEGEPVYQVAHLSRSSTPGEAVTLWLLQDGVPSFLLSEASPRQFDCLGMTLHPPGPGSYRVEVRTAAELLAAGAFEVDATDR